MFPSREERTSFTPILMNDGRPGELSSVLLDPIVRRRCLVDLGGQARTSRLTASHAQKRSCTNQHGQFAVHYR